jgi:S1-C subfamily serine protease
MSRLRRGELVVLAALIVTACEQPSRIQPVYDQAVIRVSNPETTRPVQFSRIVVDLKRGEQIGTYREGVDWCSQPGTLVYRGGRMSLDDSELTETFREELTRANYRVVGDPDALFDDPSSWQAEFLVAGRVTKIDADLCFAYMTWEQVERVSGAAVMEVEWQVYSRLDRKVVHQTRTRGRGEVTEPSTTGDTDILQNAFAQATRNLLADRRFHDLIAGEGEGTVQTQSVSAQVLQTAVPMPRTKAFTGSIAKNSERVRQGVVTILVADGHGSGFFIDDAGHLLTNAHVVRGTDRVKVVLAGGLEATGNVLARDPRRDVALLKVDLGKTTALPLRAVKPGVGAEVYAMGSPFDPSLSATLSKGIVSAYRTMDGLDFIQSDVNVMGGSSGGPLLDASGNVIGMTVSGIEAGDVPMGLNYFIPIGDALSGLGIGSSARKQPEVVASASSPDSMAQPAPQVGSLALTKTTPRSMAEVRSNIVGVVTESGVGAGFIIDHNGHMLANAHLLGSSNRVRVRLADGQSFEGKVVARADQLDLALVRVDEFTTGGLRLELTPAHVGTQVYTFGSPFAPGSGVGATNGVVRAIRNQAGYAFIQTDIKAMPDYGGGPLLDFQNNVVGVAILGPVFDGPPPGADTFLSIADALRALGIGPAS